MPDELHPGQQGQLPNQPMHLGAVVAGWAADIGVTYLIGIILGICLAIVVMFDAAFQGRNINEAQVMADISALALSLPVLLGGMVLGSMASVLGGFVSAFIARRDEIWHALATGTLSLLTGLLLTVREYMTGGIQQPLWYTIIGVLLVYPCALLGGWLCSRMCAGRRLPAPDGK